MWVSAIPHQIIFFISPLKEYVLSLVYNGLYACREEGVGVMNCFVMPQ